jgi:hypothetical protein
VYISAFTAAALVLTISLVPINVNASGFGRCSEESTSSCEQRDRHHESYCIAIEDDLFCDDVDICDDEGDVTSEDQFCTGEAVRTTGEGCPEDTHVIEGDESGLCYSNDVPCPEGDYEIPESNPSYPGQCYCDNFPPKK